MISSRYRFHSLVTAAAFLCLTNYRAKADSLASAVAAYNSGGTVTSTNYVTFSSNGYVGSFINVTTAGAISFSVAATGVANPAGVSPRLTLSVADSKLSFSPSTAANTYTLNATLPVGTYFVRAQLDNGVAARAPNSRCRA